MAWSIAEVARMARTTSRTLRHYHQIGLLEPAWIGENGYRYYGREQLLRLQQILLLRELDVDLDTIGDILAGQQDPVDALRAHQRRIAREQRRLERLQRTLGRTLAHIERGAPMPAQDYFDAFGEKQKGYEHELIERLRDDARQHIEESVERTKRWTQEDWASAMDDFQVLLGQIADLKRQAVPHDADAVQALVAGHHEWLARFWTADREAYAGLAELYALDDRFRVQIDAVELGLAGYFHDAMKVYAERRLA